MYFAARQHLFSLLPCACRITWYKRWAVQNFFCSPCLDNPKSLLYGLICYAFEKSHFWNCFFKLHLRVEFKIIMDWEVKVCDHHYFKKQWNIWELEQWKHMLRYWIVFCPLWIKCIEHVLITTTWVHLWIHEYICDCNSKSQYSQFTNRWKQMLSLKLWCPLPSPFERG